MSENMDESLIDILEKNVKIVIGVNMSNIYT